MQASKAFWRKRFFPIFLTIITTSAYITQATQGWARFLHYLILSIPCYLVYEVAFNYLIPKHTFWVKRLMDKQSKS
jgi:hypothetical protein